MRREEEGGAGQPVAAHLSGGPHPAHVIPRPLLFAARRPPQGESGAGAIPRNRPPRGQLGKAPFSPRAGRCGPQSLSPAVHRAGTRARRRLPARPAAGCRFAFGAPRKSAAAGDPRGRPRPSQSATGGSRRRPPPTSPERRDDEGEG